MDIKELSAKYAEQNVNSILTNALQNAYEAGYRQAVKDCEESNACKCPVSEEQFPEDVKFVDLNLPSGTLWAIDKYRTSVHNSPEHLSEPTKEDLEELKKYCILKKVHVQGSLYEYRILGRNGNYIGTNSKGNFFWLKDSSNEMEGWCTFITDRGEAYSYYELTSTTEFKGIKLTKAYVKKG